MFDKNNVCQISVFESVNTYVVETGKLSTLSVLCLAFQLSTLQAINLT